MHFYAFGSVCRGELDFLSDVDLLVVTRAGEASLDAERFSIYSYSRLEELWREGNPFAWHLHLESRLLFADDGVDYIAGLGRPRRYQNAGNDCERFARMFTESAASLHDDRRIHVFDLSVMFLAIRNCATCYSLSDSATVPPTFSRHAALKLGDNSLEIDERAYEVLFSARILSTRGIGLAPSGADVGRVLLAAEAVQSWLNRLVAQVRKQ